MSKAAVSVRLFGIYVMALGVFVVAGPNLLLGMFGLPLTTEVWIRVVGVLAFNIGLFNYVAAASEYKPYFEITVVTRCLVLASFIGFVALGMAPPALILFGLVDFAGAMWTWFALRADAVGTR
jgi:hypothetical protein